MEYALAFVIMLSVLIFVHEAGHCIVAKLCGVRVLKFSLGFGPPIGFGRYRLLWKWGHTEYVIACIPLGGFVKMLGETPNEVGDSEVQANLEESLPGQPLWKKLSIVFAGPAMNLAFPVLVFMATLFIGSERRDAVIGTVEIGSPAALAGLAPGERILAIDGNPVKWWDEVKKAIITSPGETLSVETVRGDVRQEWSLAVSTRSGLDPFGKVQAVGWLGLGQRRLRSVLGIPDPHSPAALAGLRSGDRVTAVEEHPVEDWPGFAGAYLAAGTVGEVTLDIERPAEDATQSLRFRVPALGDVANLGVVPATVLILAVSPDSPAERGGLAAGDLILAVDGAPIGSFASFAETVRTSGGRPLALVYGRGGTLHDLTIAPELLSIDSGLGFEEPRTGRRAVEPQRQPAGRRRGERRRMHVEGRRDQRVHAERQEPRVELAPDATGHLFRRRWHSGSTPRASRC